MTSRKRKPKKTRTLPDVSVLMPVRDADADKLQTSIQSVFVQDDVVVEIVICDDGSQDADALVKLATPPALKVARHDESQGIAEAQNTAAELAEGRYFVVLGAGDWFEQGALAAMVKHLDAHNAVDFAYGCTQYHGLGNELYCPPAFDKRQLFRSFLCRYAYMYRRSAWDAGCRYTDYITSPDGQRLGVQDRDFLMQLMVNLDWDGVCLQETTVLHYVHEHGSTWDDVLKHRQQIMDEFQRRWPMSGGAF